MFSVTGVIEPDPDLETMNHLADAYERLRRALHSAHSATTGAVVHILDNNDGPAASAFRDRQTGDGSVAEHLTELMEAAGRTKDAYSQAAVGAGAATVAMKIIAVHREQQLRQLLRQLDLYRATVLVGTTRAELLKLESLGVTRVNEAFSDLKLPERMNTDFPEGQGRVDPLLAEEWERIHREDPEQLKQILQQMADEYADEHGMPRIEIEFNSLVSPTGGTLWGSYTNSDPPRVQLNVDLLDRPELIHTVIHEMEHARQYYGMGPREPGEDVRGSMTTEEGQRWSELNETYVRDKGGDRSYNARPIEVGAREAGRDFLTNLSVDEFRDQYL